MGDVAVSSEMRNSLSGPAQCLGLPAPGLRCAGHSDVLRPGVSGPPQAGIGGMSIKGKTTGLALRSMLRPQSSPDAFLPVPAAGVRCSLMLRPRG